MDCWGSVPCSPWSTWQNMCVYLYGEPYRMKLHRARLLSKKIIRNYIKVAETVLESGGRIAFEWPRHASGWALPEVQDFLKRWGLFLVDFDGCAMGMKDKHGNPVLKQWRIATSCPKLAQTFAAKRCKHEKDFKHAVIEGGLTKLTESYPEPMCECILNTWYPEITNRHVPVMTCLPCSEEIPGRKEGRKEGGR